MTKRLQVYKCEVCGNIVQVSHAGVGTLICCNKSMRLLEEKTEDEGREKHKPVIEKTVDGIKVLVGTVPHPMEKDHYIEWIEVLSRDNICIKFLSPGQPPEAYFKIQDYDVVREYCTVHGLWSA